MDGVRNTLHMHILVLVLVLGQLRRIIPPEHLWRTTRSACCPTCRRCSVQRRSSKHVLPRHTSDLIGINTSLSMRLASFFKRFTCARANTSVHALLNAQHITDILKHSMGESQSQLARVAASLCAPHRVRNGDAFSLYVLDHCG